MLSFVHLKSCGKPLKKAFRVEGKKSFQNIRITRIGSGSVMISLCTCVVLCCDRIQVGVLDTSRDVRLVIR